MKGQHIQNINKPRKNIIIRKQDIILFLYCTTKCPTEAEKLNIQKLPRTKRNQIQQNLLSCTCTIKASI